MQMRAMYWAASDTLALAARLASAQDLPSADVLQRRIVTLLDQMDARGTEAGIPRQDLIDARYALVAFIDEQISRSAWPAKQEWMIEPLQLAQFNENTAGEGFYHRMAALERDPSRADVLQIYFLCLALGFQGQYAVRGAAGLAAVADATGQRVARALPPGENISPHGLPQDTGRLGGRRQAPIIAMAIALVVLSGLTFAALRTALAFSISDAKGTIDADTRRMPAALPTPTK